MKKITILALLALFLVCVKIAPVSAAPMPNLSSVKIFAVGPNSNNGWITAPASSYNIYGDTIYFCVKYAGYPNWSSISFYQNGLFLGQASKFEYQSENITSSGIVVGYLKGYAIPVSATGYLGSFSVQATGINGGIHSDIVNNVKRM